MEAYSMCQVVIDDTKMQNPKVFNLIIYNEILKVSSENEPVTVEKIFNSFEGKLQKSVTKEKIKNRICQLRDSHVLREYEFGKFELVTE